MLINKLRAQVWRGVSHLAFLLIVLIGLIGSSTHAAAVQLDVEQELKNILDGLDLSSSSSRHSGAQQVAELGPDVVPHILLALGRTDDPSGTRREVLLGACSSIPNAELYAVLRELAHEAARSELRPGALNLLGGMGTGGDLRLMIRIATKEPDDLSDNLRSALANVLRHNPSAYSNLWPVSNDSPSALLPSIVDAITDVGDARGLPTLAGLLNDSRRIAAYRVLQAITSVAEHSHPPFDMRVLADVRRLLGQAHGENLAAAAKAVSRLEDFEATQKLIELLNSDIPRVKTEALQGLHYLTGLNFRSDSTRWAAWYESERRWWQDEAPAVIDALDSPETAKVLAAINAIVSRRLFRGELAAELARLLDHPNEGLRSLACTAMGQLGSSVEVPTLIDCLNDNTDAVRASAAHALKKITGLDLPPDPASWLDALGLNS